MAQYYVAQGHGEAGYSQTGISINWLTKVIFVPQFFLTFVSGTTYTLDTNLFRLALRDLEDDEAGITFPPTHNHNTEVTLSGVTYARVIEIINGYTVTFEDGLYAVNLVGSNNNIPDVLNLNQVSVRASNSAGLQNVSTPTNVVTGTALTAEETANAVWSATTRTLTALGLTPEQIATALLAAATATPIHANVKQMNSTELLGTGIEADKWRGSV